MSDADPVNLVRHLVATTTQAVARLSLDKPAKTLLADERKAVRAILKALGTDGNDEQVDQVVHRHVVLGVTVKPAKAVEQPADRPWKGARIVKLFSVKGSGKQSFPMAAVRKRPGDAGYEAVTGHADYGHRVSNSFHGYVWTALLGVGDTADKAEAMLSKNYGAGMLHERPSTGEHKAHGRAKWNSATARADGRLGA